MSRKISVCLSPELIHQHDLTGKVVVVVDIFRATSCIVTGMASGVTAMRPVMEVEECLQLKEEGYILAGERNGLKLEGFDLGNSPYGYIENNVSGKKVAICTTNGTKAILKSKAADEVLIGAFLNIETVSSYLLQIKKDIVIHCAGWKDRVNMEDTLFAGALIDECAEEMEMDGDEALIAHQLFVANHDNIKNIALQSSHAHRLSGFGIEKDMDFCLKEDEYKILPRLIGEEIGV